MLHSFGMLRREKYRNLLVLRGATKVYLTGFGPQTIHDGTQYNAYLPKARDIIRPDTERLGQNFIEVCLRENFTSDILSTLFEDLALFISLIP